VEKKQGFDPVEKAFRTPHICPHEKTARRSLFGPLSTKDGATIKSTKKNYFSFL
jgi:hypothetical protein